MRRCDWLCCAPPMFSAMTPPHLIRHSRESGNPALFRFVLKRQVSRLPSRNEVVGFRLQASYFLAAAPKSNQKTPPPCICALPSQKKKRDGRVPCAPQPERGPPTGHPWPDVGRFGILPRPARTRAPADVRSGFAVLGADNGGENQKPQQRQKPSAAASSPPSPCGRGLGGGVGSSAALWRGRAPAPFPPCTTEPPLRRARSTSPLPLAPSRKGRGNSVREP